MENLRFYDVDLIDIKNNIEKRVSHFDEEKIYILPEIFGDNEDILNEFAPEFKKLLSKRGNDCQIIYNASSYSYLSLRDSDIILPIIMGISTGVIANFLTSFIQSKIPSSKTVKVNFISKNNEGEYKQFEIKGSSDKVVDILEQFKEM